ncbi:protein COFACTOR ASSEMBLY OF COMPLEX C SUBUNIT B CCB3, chloroplastic-like [Papaver somniferum]|uniref:protein COFACTOR ASSEMBLY OF COMPLEX C SUBUNIT B CCB3, chloroplastic-like n=1 Tax=Papaver somniferum TaxID=3469 RepID=UPI000E6FDB0B|nr:protein COFACTOR ASSEMBLY OF COMPLEX C SUBUNIT B CCB3, chloroplastic-like [Papaver somniferum]
MATSSSFLLSRLQTKGLPAASSLSRQRSFSISENSKCLTKSRPCSGLTARYGTYCFLGIAEASNSAEVAIPFLESLQNSLSSSAIPPNVQAEVPHPLSEYMQGLLLLGDLDPATAKVAIGILGPFLSGFGFLFIIRIVMSWYPKLPVGKFPYVLVYAPTEPILNPTRKVIPPLGGVDVTPVVWFALISFLNEILLGPQGLLVLLSQQV